MVARRDLRPSPAKALARELAKARRAGVEQTTAPHGVADMGTTGDTTFIRPDGSQASVRHTDATATQALDAATNAQFSADGKSTIWYQPSTTPPPANFVRDGDTWLPPDTGQILRWAGEQWQAVQLDGTAALADASIGSAKIAALDAGKITTGTLATQRLDAASMSALLISSRSFEATASGNASKAGMYPEGFVVYQVDPDTGSQQELTRLGPRRVNLLDNPSFETDLASPYSSNVTQARVTDWAATGITSIKLTPTGASNDAWFAPYGAPTSVSQFSAGLQAGKTFTFGATAHLTAAQKGNLSAYARTIAIAWVNKDGSWTIATSQQAPNVAGDTRLSVTATIPADAQRGYVRLYAGSDDESSPIWFDALTIERGSSDGSWFDPSTDLLTLGQGASRISLDGKGQITAKTVNADTMRLGGKDVAGMIAAGPQGIIGFGQRFNNTPLWRTSQTRIIELWAFLRSDRTYRISSSSFEIALQDSGTSWADARILYFTPPFTSWDNVYSLISNQFQLVGRGGGTGAGFAPPLISIFQPGGAGGTKQYGFILAYSADQPSAATAAWDNAITLTVEDIGPYQKDNAIYWDDGAEGSTAPPPAPAPVQYTKTYWANGVASYWYNDRTLDQRNDAVQGTYAGGAPREGYWQFPDMTADLAGSTINGIWVEMTNKMWYWGSGGVGQIWLHGASSLGATDPGTNGLVGIIDNWGTGSRRGIWVPDNLKQGFANGSYRGIAVGVGTDPNLTYYGRFNGDASLTITYTK